jgi:hypothetical protein
VLGCIREHALVVGRSRAANDREVLVELKARIVHPDRSTAPERHVDDAFNAASEPRPAGASTHLRQPCDIEMITDIEQQYCPDLH